MTTEKIAQKEFGRFWDELPDRNLLAYGAACAERAAREAVLEFREHNCYYQVVGGKRYWFMRVNVTDSAWPKETK